MALRRCGGNDIVGDKRGQAYDTAAPTATWTSPMRALSDSDNRVDGDDHVQRGGDRLRQ